jgi:hypothetical protein
MCARFPDPARKLRFTASHRAPSLCLDRWGTLCLLEVPRLSASPECAVYGCGPAPDSHRLPLWAVLICSYSEPNPTTGLCGRSELPADGAGRAGRPHHDPTAP